MMKKLFAIIYLTSLFACGQHHVSHHIQKHVADQKVHCYRQRITNQDGSSSFIFWYMIWTLNNQSCYYYSSDVPITNYSTISWQESDDSPLSTVNPQECEQMPDQVVPEQDMSPEMQAEMNDNAEYFGGMTEDQMGDYENSSDQNATDNSNNGSDNSSDGGSSDGGSGDGGGGDGGDGGGD